MRSMPVTTVGVSLRPDVLLLLQHLKRGLSLKLINENPACRRLSASAV
jgi:hypothetical protein